MQEGNIYYEYFIFLVMCLKTQWGPSEVYNEILVNPRLVCSQKI